MISSKYVKCHGSSCDSMFFHCVFPFFPGTPSSLVCLRTCVSCVGAASCLRSTWAITTPLCNHLIYCSMRTLAFSPPLARFSFIQAFCDISSLPALQPHLTTNLNHSPLIHPARSLPTILQVFHAPFAMNRLKPASVSAFVSSKNIELLMIKSFFFSFGNITQL